MSDLIERLRMACSLPTGLYGEAADELERLQRENETLRLAYDKQHELMQRENEELRKACTAHNHNNEYCTDQITTIRKENEELREELAAVKASTEQWSETMRQKKEWADEKDAEPVAWMLNWNVWFDPLEKRPDGTTPLYTTPPTAAALVEDFKRRVLKVIRPSPTLEVSKALQLMKETADGVREVLADIIESLPLIEGEK